MAANQALLARITARPDVLGGKPIIRDLRVAMEWNSQKSPTSNYPVHPVNPCRQSCLIP